VTSVLYLQQPQPPPARRFISPRENKVFLRICESIPCTFFLLLREGRTMRKINIGRRRKKKQQKKGQTCQFVGRLISHHLGASFASFSVYERL